MSGSFKLAYLAEGKLYLFDSASSAATSALVESPFVQGILDRVERNREQNDWKSQGMGWSFSRGAPGLMGMTGMASAPAETRRIRFTGVTAGGSAGKLFYSLDTDHVGGLFERNLVED